MQACAIRHACFFFVVVVVVVCLVFLFWCKGDWWTWLVSSYCWCTLDGHSQSVRSHFPINHTSVRLTQACPKYWPKLHNQARRPRERYLRSDKENEWNVFSRQIALTPPKALIAHHSATKPLQLTNIMSNILGAPWSIKTSYKYYTLRCKVKDVCR